MNDWPSEIVRGVLVQQRIEELGEGHLWRRYLPEAAATEDELLAVERELGHPLDPLYRTFLRYADGWRCFYQDVDLFGIRQLLGAQPMDAAVIQFAAIRESEFLIGVGMPKADVLPIAASPVQADMFLLARPWSRHPGTVSWWSGQLIERFPDFDEFYLAMLDYNRKEIQYLEEEARRSAR
jgi:hypothetical protein